MHLVEMGIIQQDYIFKTLFSLKKDIPYYHAL